MVIRSIKLTERPRMNEYTEQDILLDFNPTKIIDTVEMGADLQRQGYWGDRFVTYIITSPTNNTTELEELIYVYQILYKACPDLLKVFWFKKGESFIISCPYMKTEQNIQNFIDIKSELTRIIQFFIIRGYKEEEIIENIKIYKKMMVSIIEPVDEED